MQDNNTKDNNNQRNLSDAFAELKKARNNSMQAKKEQEKDSEITQDIPNLNNDTNKSDSKSKSKISKKDNISRNQKAPKAKKIKNKEPKIKTKKSNFSGNLRYKFDTLRSNKKKFRQFIILSIVYLIIIIALIIFIVSYISNKNKTENPYGDFNTYEKNLNLGGKLE